MDLSIGLYESMMWKRANQYQSTPIVTIDNRMHT